MQSQELIAVRKQWKEKQVKALTLHCDQPMATIMISNEIFPWHRSPAALCCSAHLGVRGWQTTRQRKPLLTMELRRGNQLGERRGGQALKCCSSSSQIVYSLLAQ